METEWVLRSAYQLPRHEMFETLRMFLDLPRVFSQDRQTALAALGWADRGMDFADALHLASAADCDGFASFDRDLWQTAANADAPAVRAP
jgi:predicted nucleic-acid-binding protein